MNDTAAITFGPDGRLYVGSMAGPIRVFEPSTLELVSTHDAPPFSSHNHLALTAGGLIVGAGDHHLVGVDSSSGAIRWSVDIRASLHPWLCPWLAVAESAGRVYCGNHFGVIEERDPATGERTGAFLDPQLNDVGDLAVSSDGRELVAFGASAPVISRWRLDGSGPIIDHVAEGHVVYAGWDPSGETIVVAARDANATVFDDFDDFALWDPVTDEVNDPFEYRAEGGGWSGSFLVGYFLDDPVGLGYYDVGARRLTTAVEFGDGACCTFQSAGPRRWMYVAFDDGEVWTVDTLTQQRVEPTIEAGGPVRHVAATVDGSRIAVTFYGPSDTMTAIYDGRTGEPISGPLAGPGITGISPDGVLLGADGGEITQYDLDTLESVGEFAGARGEVNSLQFSDDGTILLVTANDQTVALYDVATRTRLGDPVPTAAPFIVPGFLRPDGRLFAITDRTGVAIWHLDPQRQADAACQLAGRNLTTTEWSTYLAYLGPYRRTCPDFPAGG